MTLKASEIIEIYDSLTKIADKEIDFNTACIIAKNIKNLSISKEIFDKKRNEIVLRYGEKDEAGNLKENGDGSVKIEDMNGFMSEINNLLDSETDVDITQISKESIKDLKISAKDVMGLIKILTEE